MLNEIVKHTAITHAAGSISSLGINGNRVRTMSSGQFLVGMQRLTDAVQKPVLHGYQFLMSFKIKCDESLYIKPI